MKTVTKQATTMLTTILEAKPALTKPGQPDSTTVRRNFRDNAPSCRMQP